MEGEWSTSRLLVACDQKQELAANQGSHVRGSPLKAGSGAGFSKDGEVECLGTEIIGFDDSDCQMQELHVCLGECNRGEAECV
jgi:hypothetical protein